MDWQRLFRPAFWLQNEPTNLGWDRLLNDALDRFEIEPGYLVAKIGPFDVWTGNWPYAFGHRYDAGPKGLPCVATRLRLKRALDLLERQKNQSELAKAGAELVEAERAKAGSQ